MNHADIVIKKITAEAMDAPAELIKLYLLDAIEAVVYDTGILEKTLEIKTDPNTKEYVIPLSPDTKLLELVSATFIDNDPCKNQCGPVEYCMGEHEYSLDYRLGDEVALILHAPSRGSIRVSYTWAPTVHGVIPDYIFKGAEEAIVRKTLELLMLMTGYPWFSVAGAGLNQARYDNAISIINSKRRSGGRVTDMQMRGRWFL